MGDKETGPSSLFSLKHDKNILHPRRDTKGEKEIRKQEKRFD